ncbi:MAG: hypothetical protein GY842_11520 [bacterium]|nr:hypothetical protein [bacterium]
MTRVYENEVFTGYRDRDSARVFSNIEFRRCVFINCGVSITRDPRLRTTVRRVQLLDCARRRDAAGIGCPIVEDCLVENLKTEDLLLTWGAVFKHVTLKGRIGRIMISTGICPTAGTTQQTMRSFEEANRAYYDTVDWALDIGKAEFQECDIRGIPSRLIRRDPETQVVVTREKALQGTWKELDLEKTYWQTAIGFMLKREDPDVVLVAPKRARDFTELLQGLQRLRDAGVAEPD